MQENNSIVSNPDLLASKPLAFNYRTGGVDPALIELNLTQAPTHTSQSRSLTRGYVDGVSLQSWKDVVAKVYQTQKSLGILASSGVDGKRRKKCPEGQGISNQAPIPRNDGAFCITSALWHCLCYRHLRLSATH